MKKKHLKTLRFKKKLVSNLNSEKTKGGTGVSGACTSSMNHHQCYFACPESVYAPCG